MGMTLWISTLDGRNLTKNTNDHSAMHRYADALDVICERLNVEKLSLFFDVTDLQYNFREASDEDGEVQEDTLDPETGCAYGIDDMQWFDSAFGLATLTALQANVGAAAELKLNDATRRELLEELDDCIAMLRESAARNGKFHLAVIM